MKFNIPWHRYATIAHLSHHLQERPTRFGKTALQKMVFLLQEVFDVPLGYRFTLYNYGPYSTKLASDLEFTRQLGGVSVTWVPDDPGGFQIEPGRRYETVRERGSQTLTGHWGKIDEVITNFGQKPARELELITTAIFVNRDPKYRTEEDLLKAIRALKPYFSVEEIQNVISDLRDRKLIQLNQP